MASNVLKTVWNLHKDLAEELNGVLAPDTGDTLIQSSWDKLAYRLKGPELLTSVEAARLKSMHNVFDILESKGIIQHGRYDNLKKIFKDIQLLQCHEIILSYEEKIKDADTQTLEESQLRTKSRQGESDRFAEPAVPRESVALPGSSEMTHNLETPPRSGHVRTLKDIAKNVKITSSIKARKTKHSIIVIVPVTKDTAWVSADYRDQRLTLINRNGIKIRESVQICEGKRYVMDAIRFLNEHILVTYTGGDKVLRMSEDGQTTNIFYSTFRYYIWGLCVTQNCNILLCLKAQNADEDSKIVRLNCYADPIQTIQYDDRGAVLYSWPVCVTSLQTGEIAVVDINRHMRVSCVTLSGKLKFIWCGGVPGRKFDNVYFTRITHDKYGNLFITDKDYHRLYVLSKDGTEALCLLDSTHGLVGPNGVVVGVDGQLWVGCVDGRIKIIEY